jgi:hypothetical protein
MEHPGQRAEDERRLREQQEEEALKHNWKRKAPWPEEEVKPEATPEVEAEE